MNRGIEPVPSSHSRRDTPPGSAAQVPGVAFSPTQWSVVLAARSDSSGRREALEQLCAAYWPPVYHYLRRRKFSQADAEDLAQGFFVHLLESDFLDRPDPALGRFRGYLVGALRHFLASQLERASAEKRGGRARFLEWSSAEAERDFAALATEEKDPAEAYEATWALTLLGRALKRLEVEQAGAGKDRSFAILKPFLSQAPSQGDYQQAAAALGATRTHVAVLVHRLNQRYRELVRMEVAATVQDPTEVNDELRHLLMVISR